VGGRVCQRDTLAGIVGGNQGTFTQAFTWSDLGVPATVTYPQKAGVGPSRTVTFDYTNGWLSRVHEGSTNYASSVSYHANGTVNQVVRPNSTTDTYAKDANDIGRPASVTVRGPLGLTLWNTGTYTWDGAGNVKAMGSDVFTYDKVSRLWEGKIASVSKKQCLVFDAFGNVRRADVIASTGTCQTTPSISIDPATNRLNAPVTYDAAGNQTSWNSGAYVYWWYPTGQMRQFDSSGRVTIHGYTADGERVGTYDSYAPAGITYTLRGLDGKVLRVYREASGVWTWVQDYVYRDGAHLATVDSSGTRHFHLDHLGSIRLITNSSGTQVALHTYYPFGQEATTSGQDSERMKFTGHELDLRDSSGTTDDLYYMHARHYNLNLGRFLSVDPGRDVDPKIPQAWNMYAYVRNNPMKYVDADGRWIAVAAGGREADLKAILLQLMVRPSGRAALERLASDPAKGAVFQEGTMKPVRAWEALLRANPGAKVTMGLTERVPPYTSTTFKATIDITAAARFHPTDPSGLTTTAHEVNHMFRFFSGASTDQVQGDDRRPFAAETWAQSVASEKPDTARQDEEALRRLQQLLNQWLTEGNARYVAQTEPPKPKS
jgi:RHS repeat-associated protein